MDDKIEAVFMTSLPENKLLKTERVTTRDEVHKCTYNITTSEEFVKVTDDVHKYTENITTNEKVEKVTENWKIWNRKWSKYVGRIQISLRVSLKDLQDGLILITSLKQILHLNQTSIKTLWKVYLKSRYGTV